MKRAAYALALVAAVALAAVLLSSSDGAAGRVTGMLSPAALLRGGHGSGEDSPSGGPAPAAALRGSNRRKVKPYTSPSGLFIQERASKGLPGPGQHFSFGALKPWDQILEMLEDRDANRKLLLVVRHGQAVSNYLSDALGPDEWFSVEGTCDYTGKDGTHWDIFDADLTELGTAQAQSLNSMLAGGGWFKKITGGRPVRAIVSPLTRCLNTAANVLKGLPLNATNVEELVRETLGEDTCDARRSVSDPPKDPEDDDQDDDSDDDGDDTMGKDGKGKGGKGGKTGAPCSFDKGLRSKFPNYKFRVWDARDDEERGFGLLGDEDHLWTKDTRERQQHQVKRARRFLDILWANTPEKVAVIVTHSGFTRSLLLAVEREPYRPNNAEMVPVIVDKNDDYNSNLDEDEYDEEEVQYEQEESTTSASSETAAAARAVADALPRTALRSAQQPTAEV